MVFAPRSMALAASLGAAGVTAAATYDENNEKLADFRKKVVGFEDLSVTDEVEDADDKDNVIPCKAVLAPLVKKVEFDTEDVNKKDTDKTNTYYKKITTIKNGAYEAKWYLTDKNTQKAAGGKEGQGQVRVYKCVKQQAEELLDAHKVHSADMIQKSVQFRMYAILYFYFITFTLTDNDDTKNAADAVFLPESNKPGHIEGFVANLKKASYVYEIEEAEHFGGSETIRKFFETDRTKDKNNTLLLDIYKELAIDRGTGAIDWDRVPIMKSAWKGEAKAGHDDFETGVAFKENVERIIKLGDTLLDTRAEDAKAEEPKGACQKDSYKTQGKRTDAACHAELKKLLNIIKHGDAADPKPEIEPKTGLWKAQKDMMAAEELLYSQTKVLRVLQAGLGLKDEK